LRQDILEALLFNIELTAWQLMNDRRGFYFETIYVFMCTINPIISDEGSNAIIDHFCIFELSCIFLLANNGVIEINTSPKYKCYPW